MKEIKVVAGYRANIPANTDLVELHEKIEKILDYFIVNMSNETDHIYFELQDLLTGNDFSIDVS